MRSGSAAAARRARGSSDPAPGSAGRRSRPAPAARTIRGGRARPSAPGAAPRSRSRCRPPPGGGAPSGNRWRPPGRRRRRRSSSGWRRRRPAAPAPSRRAAAGAPPRRAAAPPRPALPASRPARGPRPSSRSARRLASVRPFQLQLVEAHHRPVVAQGAVDLARRLDRLDVLLRQLARPLRVADRAFQAREMVQEQLAHLRFQLGDARRIAGAGDRRRLHLQHRHVVGGAALLAVDVLQAGRRADVRGVAVDGVDQVGLGALGVAQLVDAQLGGQVEELAGLGAVFDRLRARLVQRRPACRASAPVDTPYAARRTLRCPRRSFPSRLRIRERWACELRPFAGRRAARRVWGEKCG